uniref:Retrotransposon Copia-like N-terminal domain-containing protein n=1 Tax=Fagus sylvatica TaxID=28930 RepID=A0A2N9FV86_FAGSY
MSSTSSSTTQSSSTISFTFIALTSLPHIQHLITIKLNRDNYLLWKAQIVPYLRGQHLYGFIDGTKPAPPPSLAVQASCTTAVLPNPEFYTWHTQDQMILSALISSLSETVLAHVDFNLVSFFLVRLGSDYDALVTAIQQCCGDVTLDELYGDFLSHELRLAQHQPSVDLSLASANFANRSFSNRGSCGGKSSTPPASSNSSRGFSSNQQCQHRGRGRGRGTYNNSPCTKSGHIALTCYQRFDNSYTVESTPNMQALLANPNHAPDPNWYSDSGATHNLTSDLANLNVRADEYHGPDQICVGSGLGENTVMRVE